MESPACKTGILTTRLWGLLDWVGDITANVTDILDLIRKQTWFMSLAYCLHGSYSQYYWRLEYDVLTVFLCMSVNLIAFLFCLFAYWVVCETKTLSYRSTGRVHLYHSPIGSWYKSTGLSCAKTIIYNISLLNLVLSLGSISCVHVNRFLA